MRKHPALILLASTATMAFTATAVATAAPPDPLPPQARQILDNYRESGTLTAEEETALKEGYPKIAAQVIDPMASPQISAEFTDTAKPKTVTNHASCKGVDYSVRRGTLLGQTAYVYHGYARFCWNGSSVTSVSGERHALSESDGFEYLKGYVSGPSTSGVGSGQADTFMQGRVDNCIAKYGCITTTYPYVDIHMRANGSSYADTGVG